MPWQLYKAPRYPDVIVRPNHASEVAEVVRASYREGRRLAIKSGGHNVSEVFLRDGGLLLDLGELQDLQVSADQNSAWVETRSVEPRLTRRPRRAWQGIPSIPLRHRAPWAVFC